MYASNSVSAPVDRAHRLLQGMQQVCSHDLPNQSVALESLLHLFAMDEADQLSPQAREYLQRLQSVAHKIAGMAQYLRDLIRLDRHQPDVGEIVFERLTGDLRAELQRRLPEHAFTWNMSFDVPAAQADRRLLLPAVAALIQGAAEFLGVANVHVTLSSAGPDAGEPDGAVALRVRIAASRSGAPSPVSPTPPTPATPPASATSAATKLDRRLEFALGYQLLALAGIACGRDEVPGAVAFVLSFPS